MRCPFPLSPALSDLPPQFKLLLSLCDQGCRAMKTKAGRRLGKLLAPRGMLLIKYRVMRSLRDMPTLPFIIYHVMLIRSGIRLLCLI